MRETDHKTMGPQVEIESSVWVKFPSGETNVYTITRSHQTDPDHGIISCDSPLGKALLGKNKGDKITYMVQNRSFEVDIVEIYRGAKDA